MSARLVMYGKVSRQSIGIVEVRSEESNNE